MSIKGRVTPVQMLVLAIPVVNALADVTTNYLPDALLGPGGMRALYLVGVIIIALPQVRAHGLFVPLYLLLGYLLLRALAASNVATAVLDNYLKVLLSSLLLPIAFWHLRDWESLQRLHVAIVLGGVVIVAQFAIAQFLSLGTSVYVEDTFYVGGAKVQATYTLALAVVASPLILAQLHRHRRLLSLVFATFALVILLVLRRGAIAGMIAGTFVYLVLSPARLAMFKRIGAVGVCIVLAFPLYAGILLPRLAARSLENRPLVREGRFLETFWVVDDFVSESLDHAMFGSEMFNSPEYFGMERQLHIDYNILLHGGGLTAILLASLVYLVIGATHHRQIAVVQPIHHWFREMNAVFWGLLILSLVISISGSLTVIGYRSALFLYLGALLGLGSSRVRLFSTLTQAFAVKRRSFPRDQPTL